jgi:1-acyl-sn-glycerol-3-phosphate acyltransferases
MEKKTGLYRFAQIVVPLIFKLLYWYKVVGRDKVPETGAVLMCCNHSAYKDPLLLGLTQKRQIHFMAKRELFENKFLGFLVRKLGVFPVERSGGMAGIKKAIEVLKSNKVVGIFIEGTRSKTGELLKPKPGVAMLAYDSKAVIVPVAIVGKNGKPPRLFTKTIVNVGDPIPFEELNMADNSSLEMRKASRLIMEKIKDLREEILNKQ